MKCEVCKNEYNILGNHIKAHSLSNKEYYDKFLKKEKEGRCEVCNKNTSFKTLTTGYSTYCSQKCQSQDPEQRKNISEKNTGRFKGKKYKEIYGDKETKCGFQKGDNNVAKKKEIREKISEGVKNSYTSDLRKIRAKAAVERLQKRTLGTKLFYSPKNSKSLDNEGNGYRSSFELKVVEKFKEMGINYDYSKNYEQKIVIKDEYFLPDFIFSLSDLLSPEDIILMQKDGVKIEKNHTLIIEVSGYSSFDDKSRERTTYKISKFIEAGYLVFLIVYPEHYPYYFNLSQKFNSKFHVFTLEDKFNTKIKNYLRTLKITSENIDYAHLLPWHGGKCANIHGHTAKIEINLTGFIRTEDNEKPWLADFSVLKPIIKEECQKFDHKIIIGKEDIKSIKEIKENYHIKYFSGIEVQLPKTSIIFIDGSPTVENLSQILTLSIYEKLKTVTTNIIKIDLDMSEGVNNHCIFSYENEEFETRYINDTFKELMIYHLLWESESGCATYEGAI